MLKNSGSPERSRLRDYDWKLSHVLGSSSLANHQENLVTLILHLTEDSENISKVPNIKKTITVELNKSELDKLITSLENCQQKLIKNN